MRRLLGRLAGLGLLLLAVAPVLLVGTALFLLARVSLDTARSVQAGAAELADTVEAQLASSLRAIEANLASLLAESARVRGQVQSSLGQLGNIPDLAVQRGQLGSTPAIPLRVPDRNVSFGLVSIGNGQLLNQTVQGIPIPAQTVVIPTSPLRQAMTQAGQGVSLALQASERQLAGVLGELGRIAQPLRVVGEAAAGLVAPLRARAGVLTGLLWLTGATLVGFTLLYALIGLVLAFTRGRAAASAFQTGGPVGYLGFVFSFLVVDGIARLVGRPRPTSTAAAASLAEIQATVDGLRRELEELRAELPRPRLRAAG